MFVQTVLCYNLLHFSEGKKKCWWLQFTLVPNFSLLFLPLCTDYLSGQKLHSGRSWICISSWALFWIWYMWENMCRKLSISLNFNIYLFPVSNIIIHTRHWNYRTMNNIRYRDSHSETLCNVDDSFSNQFSMLAYYSLLSAVHLTVFPWLYRKPLSLHCGSRNKFTQHCQKKSRVPWNFGVSLLLTQVVWLVKK